MHTTRLLPPLIVVTGALALLSGARGFELQGGMLDLTQRDFRIFNNFNEVEANDNQVPDPDFPGALGAELAIWKGVAEWGSQAHGTGGTDPLQSDGIGSGFANFDAFYVGEHTEPGGPNQNVISMISGGSSTLAFVDIPIGDGWRMRFRESPYTWHDGPGPVSTGSEPFDLQGVASHEYGHALGLAHSSVVGTTMFAAVPAVDGGISLRSIEDDDRAGVQFIYGALSPTKPRVDTYELSAGQVTLLGENFDPLANEVWFSQALAGGDGTPVKVTGAPSLAGGTILTVAIPAAAGPGDIAVKLPGASPDQLSNAFPFDPEREPAFQAPLYYGQGTALPGGSEPEVLLLNVPSLTAGTLDLSMASGPITGLGVVFSGAARTSLPGAFGTLLVAGPLRRDAVFAYSFTQASVSVPIPPGAQLGESRYYQIYALDSVSSGTGLSRGLRVVWAP